MRAGDGAVVGVLVSTFIATDGPHATGTDLGVVIPSREFTRFADAHGAT